MGYHWFRMTAISTAYPIQTPTHHLYLCSFLFLGELVPTHTGGQTQIRSPLETNTVGMQVDDSSCFALLTPLARATVQRLTAQHYLQTAEM